MPATAASIAASAVLTDSRDVDRRRDLGFALREDPALGRHQIVEGHAIMAGEIGRMLRPAARREIGRARADDPADRPDAQRDQAAVRHLADPHRQVDMIFGEADVAVVEHQPDVDLGIGLDEFDDHRQHMQPAEHQRRGDDQLALRRAYSPAAARSASPTSSRMRRAGRDVVAAGIGQLEAAAGAVDQPRAEMRLELGDPAADGRQRNLQPARRRRQAARFDHGEQHLHRFKRSMILPDFERMASRYCRILPGFGRAYM